MFGVVCEEFGIAIDTDLQSIARGCSQLQSFELNACCYIASTRDEIHDKCRHLQILHCSENFTRFVRELESRKVKVIYRPMHW